MAAYGRDGWGGGTGGWRRGGGWTGRWFAGIPTVTAWLLKANILVFLVFGFGHLVGSGLLQGLEGALALSMDGVRHGMLWQPVTYMFLHGGLWHLVLNMLTLYFLGPDTERSMGPLHYGLMYAISGIAGGLGWLWLSGGHGFCVGASGAIFGVMGAFATLFPRRRLTFLVFVFPVTMEAWKAVIGLTALQMLMIGGGAGTGIAYAAHVMGALAGFLYIDQLFESAHFRRMLSRVAQWFGREWSFRLPRRDGRRVPPSSSSRPGDAPPEDEVNRILDKISREGIQSLTPEERDTLHRASARF
ncbi:MAG: rhomboid family intramembrane serine protease [Kiritimatiellae bacterium]|nr:rhomboid family intramembrane serine protease [Kiritimatiellia bacterium]